MLAPVVFAVATTFLVAWRGLLTSAFSDYDDEAAPAFDALRGADVSGFFEHLPAYGGSLLLRAPFVIASELLGGGGTAAFRMAALPCLLAALAFGLVLFARQRGTGAAWLTLAVATLNPVTLRALELGHPEELLGAVLCAAAVLAALADRPWVAGVLLGLAIGNKAWAVIAIGPVLVALRDGHVRAMASAIALAVLLWIPVMVGHGTAARPAPVTGAIFQPWQVWWFLGDHGHVVRGLHGDIKEGYRAAPLWLSPISHPLIPALVVPFTAAFALLRRDRRDALLLLALLFMCRCVLDPWNTSYYALPAIFALLTWETVRLRPPLGAAALSLLTLVTFELLPPVISPDAQAFTYLLWALPATALMALRIFAPVRAMSAGRTVRGAFERRLPSLAGLLPAPVTPPSSAPSTGR